VKPLILYPTDISQWHALVNEAQVSTELLLNESTESYLVFLLLRYSTASKLTESVLALDFLESMQKTRRHQVDTFRDIGDKSLLFCGLFPGMATKRRVSLEYFSNLGQSAYFNAGELYNNETSALFMELSAEFYRLQQVLQALRVETFAVNHK
jgi:hypothetical protein